MPTPRLLRRSTRRTTRHRVVRGTWLDHKVGVEETFGATGTLLRETKGEVVLVSRLRAAFDENLTTHHKQQVPAPFWFNTLLIASNATD